MKKRRKVFIGLATVLIGLSSTATGDSGSQSTWQIPVGVVVPLMVVLGLVICICCLVRWRKRRKAKHAIKRRESMKSQDAYSYRLEISPIREESILVNQELTRPSSFICTQINIKPLINEDREPHNKSPSPQATTDQSLAVEQESTISFSNNVKKKPLPLIPPFTEPPPKTSSFGSKSMNTLPEMTHIDLTTPSPTSQTDEAAETTTFSSVNAAPQVPANEPFGENFALANFKTKPLPQVPSQAEPRSKAASISYQKKNSLPRVTFADGLGNKLNSHCENNENKQESFTESCEKFPASHNSKKSSSLRVRHAESRDKIPTFVPITNTGNQKKSLPRRVTIGEPREKVLSSDDTKRGLLHQGLNSKSQKEDSLSQNSAQTSQDTSTCANLQAPEPQKLLPQSELNDNPTTISLNQSGLVCRVTLPEPNDKASTLSEPRVETEKGIATSKKAMLLRVPLPDLKPESLTCNSPSPPEIELEASHKASMLRRAPLPEPKVKKAPQPTARGFGNSQKSNSLRRGAPLPEPEEEAPTYSTIKLLQSQASSKAEGGRKEMVESVVYDDPLPVSKMSLMKSGAQSGKFPVYDDPLPVKKPLNVAQMFSKCREAKTYPEPEPYEIPIMKP